MKILNGYTLAALGALALVGSASALAQSSTQVAVNATVVGTCQFTTTGSTVTFTLDPSTTANATGVVTQPQFWCTKGATYTITSDNGMHYSAGTYQMVDGTGDLIPYTFTYTGTGTGAGKSTPITLDIAASVANANFVNAPAGAYSDTVTLTINP